MSDAEKLDALRKGRVTYTNGNPPVRLKLTRAQLLMLFKFAYGTTKAAPTVAQVKAMLRYVLPEDVA